MEYSRRFKKILCTMFLLSISMVFTYTDNNNYTIDLRSSDKFIEYIKYTV